MRRGISLLEVLVSMFVLLFGLMGVAAIFPVGNHYAAKGEQYDRAAAMSQAAFAEVRTRGLLKPANWQYATQPLISSLTIKSPLVIVPASATWNAKPTVGAGQGFVLDPLGAAVATDQFFPSGNPINPWPTIDSQGKKTDTDWPLRRVTLNGPTGLKMTATVAETIFRLHDDLANEQPTASDHPGTLKYSVDSTGAPLTRNYGGSYSWLATITPTSVANRDTMQPADSTYGQAYYDVTVVMFFKRVPTDQGATMPVQLNPGGLMQLAPVATSTQTVADLIEEGVKEIRPGNYVGLVGVHPQRGHCLMKWCKVQSVDADTGLMQIDDPDWPAEMTTATPSTPIYPMTALRVILLPNIIGAETQQIRLAL